MSISRLLSPYQGYQGEYGSYYLSTHGMDGTPDSGALDPVSLAEYKLVILLFWKVQEATGHVSLATESLL